MRDVRGHLLIGAARARDVDIQIIPHIPRKLPMHTAVLPLLPPFARKNPAPSEKLRKQTKTRVVPYYRGTNTALLI